MAGNKGMEGWMKIGIAAVVLFCLAGVVFMYSPKGTTYKDTGVGAPAGPVGGAPSTDCSGVEPLGTTQNMQIICVDYAQQGTAVTSTASNIYEAGSLVKSALAEATNQATTRGKGYRSYTTKSNYFTQVTDWTAPCGEADYKVNVKLPAVDGSVTAVFINSDGVTLNADSSAEQAVGSGQGVTMKMQIRGGSAYKYLSDPVINKYTIVLAYSNVSKMDTGASKVIGCTEVNVPKKYAGTGHQAFTCDGNVYNFDTKDVNIFLQALAGQNPATGDDVVVYIMPMGRVVNSVTGEILGMNGGVVENNVGTAVQTATTATAYLS